MISRRHRTTRCPTEHDLLGLLDGRLDGRLDAGHSASLSEHIDSCDACQTALDRLTSPESADRTLLGLAGRSHHGSTLAGLVDDLKSSSCEIIAEPLSGDCFSAATSESPIQFPEPPTPDAPLGRLGRYNILDSLGSGATGRLFRARDTKLDRDVAIKVLRGELAAHKPSCARFEREARAAAGLVSEHIVTVHEVECVDGFPPYLVMELVEGESLDDLLRRSKTIDPDDATHIVCGVLAGLRTAHRAGIVHRDIKPSNILIEQASGRARLADFGLARLSDQPVRLTTDGMLAGTPAYMSPEQVSSPHDVDERTDLYSVGVLLYELLTGDVPFHGVLRMVLHQVLHDEPRPPRQLNDQIPVDLQTICAKAMRKEPSLRYASAAEFHADLIRWQRGEPVDARPVTQSERLWKLCRRNPVTAALCTVLSIGLIGTLMGWLSFTLETAEANSRLRETNWSLTATNAELKVAMDRVRAGEQAAQANARLADAQLNLTFETLNSLIHDVQVHSESELRYLRRSFLQRAVVALEQLAATAASNEQTTLSLAVTGNRLGDTYRKLGRYPRARARYKRAAEWLDQVAGEASNAEAIRECRVWTMLNLGECGLAMNDPVPAGEAFRAAADGANALLAANRDNTDARRSLAVAEDRLARIAIRQKDWTGAHRHLDAARVQLELLCRHSPESDELQSELKSVCEELDAIGQRLNPTPDQRVAAVAESTNQTGPAAVSSSTDGRVAAAEVERNSGNSSSRGFPAVQSRPHAPIESP